MDVCYLLDNVEFLRDIITQELIPLSNSIISLAAFPKP